MSSLALLSSISLRPAMAAFSRALVEGLATAALDHGAVGCRLIVAAVVVSDDTLADGGGGRVLDALGECLDHHFDVEYCTFQLEPAGHAEHERAGHP